MMATRRPGTVAAINRAIDAMITKPRRNPTARVYVNRFGVRFGPKWFARAHHPRGGYIEGVIWKVKTGNDAYVTFESGQTASFDDIKDATEPIKAARKTRSVRVVAANPVKRPKSLYVVWTAAADGIKHERLATFEKLSEARKYAQAYADSSGKKMIVETKAL